MPAQHAKIAHLAFVYCVTLKDEIAVATDSTAQSVTKAILISIPCYRQRQVLRIVFL